LMARAVLGDAGMPGSFQIGGAGLQRARARAAINHLSIRQGS